jgi:tetratricopeptide (TPR) repeat protein
MGMLLFCPNCGQRFEVPGSLEASVAHKCPSCGNEFGGPAKSQTSTTAPGKLKFVSGGETSTGIEAPRNTKQGIDRGQPVPDISRPRQIRKVAPDACELGKELNQAGAGILYEGNEVETGAPVVIRKLLSEGGSIVDAERWATVATNLQNLRHPKLVSVLGVGLREGAPHIVTERVTGQNLAEYCSGRSLGVKQATQIAVQIVEGLTVAHGAGALHGDLKPTNIFVDGQGRVRVADFGLAPRSTESGELVTSNHVISWLPYAPPEMVRDGPDRADERSDSYGLGAVLYYMLTGTPPFAEDDPKGLKAAVLEETPRPPSSLNAKIPAGLDMIVMRSLEKDPAYRPTNAQAVGLELRKFERDAPVAAAAAAAAKPVVRRGSSRWPKVLLLLAILGGLGYGGYFYYTKIQLEQGMARARYLADNAQKLVNTPEGLPKAIEMYQDAVLEAVRGPEEGKYLLALSEAMLKAGDAQGAVAPLTKASNQKSEWALEAKAMLPSALARAQKLDAAIALLSELTSPDTASETALTAVRGAVDAGEGLAAEREIDQAIKILSFSVELIEKILPAAEADPAAREALRLQEMRARVVLGDALVVAGRASDARAEYLAAFASDVTGTEFRLRAAEGIVKIVAGLKDVLSVQELEAIGAFPKAVAWYARDLLARGDLDEARTVAQKASDSAGEGNSVARAWADLVFGEVEEARGLLGQARRRYDDAVSVAMALQEEGTSLQALAMVRSARISLRLGQAAAASTRFREVIKRYNEDPSAAKDPVFAEALSSALVGDGNALRLQRQPDQATKSYRLALSIAVQPADILAALAGIGEVMLETRAREQIRPSFEALTARDDAGHFGVLARAMIGDITEGQLLEEATFEGGSIKMAGPDAVARAYYCAALRRELSGEAEAARLLLTKAIQAAGQVSWYGFLARQRMPRE